MTSSDKSYTLNSVRTHTRSVSPASILQLRWELGSDTLHQVRRILLILSFLLDSTLNRMAFQEFSSLFLLSGGTFTIVFDTSNRKEIKKNFEARQLIRVSVCRGKIYGELRSKVLLK